MFTFFIKMLGVGKKNEKKKNPGQRPERKQERIQNDVILKQRWETKRWKGENLGDV